MRLISADFNAMTEAGHVRLTLPCSREDILRMGLGPGDWAWLSDGEVLVGAQLAIDDRYGLVGVPDWDTLVHLDEEGADDFNRVSAALNLLLKGEPPSIEEEPRILELLTQLEHVAPPQIKDASPGTFAFRRALALHRWASWAWRSWRSRTLDASGLRTRWSSSFISISCVSRTSPPQSRRPKQSLYRRVCPPLSCRRASISSRPKRSRRPLTSSSRLLGESSTGVAGSIKPRTANKRGSRCWPCLTSTAASCSSERARSPKLEKHSNTRTGSIP